jgi:hypothetical protein
MKQSGRLILTVTGLQRSGNHAVIDWIGSLFPSFAFHNNNPHDLFADVQGLRALIEGQPAACILFSFEDSPGKTGDAGLTLVQSVTPFPAAAFPGFTCRSLYILRDPYNQWASRMMAHRSAAERGTALTADPSWERFRADWLAFAELHEQRPQDFILFNRWFREPGYRRALCADLGGTYSEATLDHIPTAGGGSSFDALPRKGYGAMLRDWRRYASAEFAARLLGRPGYYLKRLASKPVTGADLQVDRRWQAVAQDPEARALFADPALRDEARGIFDPAGLPE